MKSTIVIPNYNGMAYIENCMNAVYAQTVQEYEVVVVDNGSKDGSLLWIKEHYPQTKIIAFEENQGFCKAVNEGIKAAETPYVVLLNNDTIVECDFLRELEKAMDEDLQAFSASAKMLVLKSPELIDDAGDYYCALGWAFAEGKGKPEERYNKKKRVFAACGGAAIYRKKIFEEIGYFDENHFAYLEDIDIGYRAKINGYHNLYAPSARVLHAGSAVSGSRYNAFKVDLSSKNNIYLIYKNMPFLQILLNLPFLVAGFLIKGLFFIKKGLGKTYFKGLWKGICLSLSKEGKLHKIRVTKENWYHFIEIEWELLFNIIRRSLQ